MKITNEAANYTALLYNNTAAPNAKYLANFYSKYGRISSFLRLIFGELKWTVYLGNNRLLLALLLRAGFVFIQLGSIPIENVYLILLQNIVDISVSTASYGLLGYFLSFSSDSFYGLIGNSTWLTSANANYDNAIIGTYVITFLNNVSKF